MVQRPDFFVVWFHHAKVYVSANFETFAAFYCQPSSIYSFAIFFKWWTFSHKNLYFLLLDIPKKWILGPVIFPMFTSVNKNTNLLMQQLRPLFLNVDLCPYQPQFFINFKGKKFTLPWSSRTTCRSSFNVSLK